MGGYFVRSSDAYSESGCVTKTISGAFQDAKMHPWELVLPLVWSFLPIQDLGCLFLVSRNVRLELTKNSQAKARIVKFLKRGVAVLDYYVAKNKGACTVQKRARYEDQISKVCTDKIFVLFRVSGVK